jgi:glycosyltransferase involved in cell wall biosynthesis
MYHGTFSPNRGLQEVIRAFCVLKNKCPDARFIMLGDGIGRSKFIELVSDCQLEDYVYILGPVSYVDIPGFVASVDVGIIPLPDIDWWNTSSPMKLFEYLAAGKPVLLSPIRAHQDVLRDHPTAYYLADVTEQEIVKGITCLYRQRYDLESKGKAGQDLVKERYTWDAQAERLLEFLYYILNR